MSFVVPTNRFTRVTKSGNTMMVERKGHTRRTVLPDAWRFHLKAMAITDEPLRYIRRFLLIEEDLSGIQPFSDEEEKKQEIPQQLCRSLPEDNFEEDFDNN